MIILALNCRGLGSSSKKKSLRRLVEVNNLDILMLQETMGDSEKIVLDLGKAFVGWDF
jgi:exonuclease III